MEAVGLKELLQAGVHFGHQTHRWNPKMRKYIFAERGGIYLIDLRKTLKELNKAAKVIQEMVDPSAEIIFGTAIDPTMSDDDVKITVIATGFQGYRASPVLDVEAERSTWSSDMLDEMGLDGDDVDLPAFLRKRRVVAQ